MKSFIGFTLPILQERIGPGCWGSWGGLDFVSQIEFAVWRAEHQLTVIGVCLHIVVGFLFKDYDQRICAAKAASDNPSRCAAHGFVTVGPIRVKLAPAHTVTPAFQFDRAWEGVSPSQQYPHPSVLHATEYQSRSMVGSGASAEQRGHGSVVRSAFGSAATVAAAPARIRSNCEMGRALRTSRSVRVLAAAASRRGLTLLMVYPTHIYGRGRGRCYKCD